MHADDTVIFHGASSYEELIPVLNSELPRLENWSSVNDLLIHSGKIEHVIFGVSQKLRQSGSDVGNYEVDDQDLKQRFSYEYLGECLDESLTFKDHIAELRNKASS